MLSKYQPSRAASTATTNRSSDPAADNLDRPGVAASNPLRVIPGARQDPRQFAGEVLLIRNWLDVIRRCATIAAHGTAGGPLDEYGELLALLEATEEAVVTRVPAGAALLDQMTGWEASLLHHAPGIASTSCLICERAREIPDDLPADYAWALRVINEAA